MPAAAAAHSPRQFELTRDLVSSLVLLIAGLSEADKLRLSPFFPYRPEEDTTAFPNILFWSIALNALHRTFPIPKEVLDDGLREEFTILSRSREGSVPEIVLELWTTLTDADSSTLTARWDKLGSVMPQATLHFTLQEEGGEQRSFRTGHAIVKAKVSKNELVAKLDVVEASLSEDEDESRFQPEMIVTPSQPQSAHEPRIGIITPLSGTYRAPLPPSPPPPPQTHHVLHPEFVHGHDPVRTAVEAGSAGVPGAVGAAGAVGAVGAPSAPGAVGAAGAIGAVDAVTVPHQQMYQASGSRQVQTPEQRPFPPGQIPPHLLPGPANEMAMASASASASEAGQVLVGQSSMSHRKTSSVSSLVATRKTRLSSGSRSSIPPTRPRSAAAKPTTQLPRTTEPSVEYIRERARQIPGLVELPDSDKCFQCLMTNRPCIAPAPFDLTHAPRTLPSGIRIQPGEPCATCHFTESESRPRPEGWSVKCSLKTRLEDELAGAQLRRAAQRAFAIKLALQRAQPVDPKELDHVLLDMATAGRYLGEYL